MGRRRTSHALLKGLIAGAAGSVAMALAARERPGAESHDVIDAGATVAETIFGARVETSAQRRNLGTVFHYSYGLQLGLVRALLPLVGLKGTAGSAAFFGLVWGTELATMTSSGLAPPVREWGNDELARDALAHGVFAAVTSVVFELLARER